MLAIRRILRYTRDRVFSIIVACEARQMVRKFSTIQHRRTYFIRIAHLENRRRKSTQRSRAHSWNTRFTQREDDDLSFRLSDFIQPTTLRDAIAFGSADATVSVTSKWNMRFSSYASRTIMPRRIDRPRSHLFVQRWLYSTGTITIYHPFVFQTYWAIPPLHAVPLNICSPLCAFYAPVPTRRAHDNL